MNTKQEKNKYYDNQKERISLYLNCNYNNIKNIKFTKIEKNPMGGIFFYGYLNNDTTINFSATISIPNSDFEDQISMNGEFSQLNFRNLKDDWRESFSVSEILAEKENK